MDAATDQPFVQKAMQEETMPSSEEEKRAKEELFQEEKAIQQEADSTKPLEPVGINNAPIAIEEPPVIERTQGKKIKKHKKNQSRACFKKRTRKRTNKKTRCLNCEILKKFIGVS